MSYSIDPQIAETLRALLLDSAGVETPAPGVVLTTDPSQWRSEARAELSVINLGPAMGFISPLRFDSELEARVVDQFLAAGWLSDSIVTHYRADLKSSKTFDVALLGPDRRPALQVEVKRSPYANPDKSHSSWEQWRAEWQRSGAARNLAPTSPFSTGWICVTDGERFQLTNRETGETRQSGTAPRPQDVGLHPPDRLSAHYAPSTLAELHALVARIAPQWVIVDPTIPWGVRVGVADLQARGEWARLLQQVPELGPAAHVEALHLLIAWIAFLPSVTRASVVVPKATLDLHGSAWLRRLLANLLAPCAILEMPADTFRPFVSLETAVLCLERGVRETYLNSVTSRRELIGISSRAWAIDFTHWLRTRQMSFGSSAAYKRTLDGDKAWTYAANHPDLGGLKARLKKISRLEPLSALSDVRRGRLNRRDAAREVNGSDVLLLQASHIRDGSLRLDGEDDVFFSTSEVQEGTLLEVGDVLLPEVVSGTFSAAVYMGGRPLVAASSVYVVRPTSAEITGTYLAEYLNSAVAMRLMKAEVMSGTGLPRLIRSRLQDLPVPVLTRGLLFEEISRVRETENRLRGEAEDLAERRSMLFDAEDSRALSVDLSELLRTGRLLTASIEFAKKPEFQIANFYPFPVAYGYRLLDSRFGVHELLKDQLRVAENVLAFLACVALSLIQASDRASSRVDPATLWRAGISPGHWRTIIAGCCAVLKTYRDHPLAEAFVSLNISVTQRGFGKLVDRLIALKNDFKHDRIDDGKVESSSSELAALLPEVMQQLAFMTDYPIRQVIDIDTTRAGAFDVVCRRYTGDHPGLSKEKLRMLLTPPRKGDLFIRTDENNWISLFPFMSVVLCPKCSTSEVYFVDRLERKGEKMTAELKSFERGHPASDEAIGNEIGEMLLQWPSTPAS